MSHMPTRRFFRRIQEKILKKTIKKNMKKNKALFVDVDSSFDLDNLEDRILLSADPILGPLQEAFVKNENSNDNNIVINETLHTSDIASNNIELQDSSDIILDFSDLQTSSSASLVIDAGDTLGGSGSLNIDLVNNGVVAPGYSPGVQNVDSYTQADAATLELEIAGVGSAGAADGYDQINASGAVSLDGTLNVTILDNYEVKEGDTFEILTFDTISGKFDDATGLYGFGDGSLYFDITQLDEKITLTAREVGDIVFDIDDIGVLKDLGLYYNQDYFDLDSKTVNVTGGFSIADFVYIDGSLSLSFGGEADVDIVTGLPANVGDMFDNIAPVVEDVNVSVFDIGITNANMFMGMGGDYYANLDDDATGLLIQDLDLGFTLMTAKSIPDIASNVNIEAGLNGMNFYALSGHADSGELVGFDDGELEARDITIDVNSSYQNKLLAGLQTFEIPDISIPSITIPDLQFPDITVPTVAFPDLTISIPDISIPTISIPDIKIPGLGFNIEIPDINLPSISIPDIVIPDFDLSLGSITLPDIEIPSITLPSIDIPELGFSITLPTIDFPSISIPTITMPDISIPTIQLPDLSLPSISFPDIEFPEIELPSLSIPSISMPTFSIPDISMPNIVIPEFNIDIDLPDIVIPDINIPDISVPDFDINVFSSFLYKLWDPAVDFQSSFGASGHEITAGGETIQIDYDGNQRIGVDIGQAKLQISEFVYLQGGFAFEKGPTYAVDIATGIPANVVSVIDSIAPLKSATDTVLGVAAIGSTLSTLNDVEVASMTIGASDIQAFVGVGGPYKSDADLGVDADGDGNAYNDYVINDDAMGVAIDNLDFGMAIMDTTSPLINPILDRFTALKATADKGGLVGFDDDAVLEAYDITIQVNDGPEWPGGHGPAVIDWATSFESSAGAGDGVFSIPTGGTNSMDINYDGNQRIGVDIGQAKLQISEFVYLQGGFAFEKGPTYAVDIATGIPANVVSVIDSIAPLKSATDTVLGVAAIGSTLSTLNDVEVASMTIGASDIQAFVGVGGPYKSDADLGVDADGDGNAYNDYVINDDAMGVAIDNLDFGMAIMDTTSPLINPILDRFTALKATADKGGLVGFDDDAVLEAYDITIQVNDGPEWPGGHGPAVIDWATSFESSAGAGDGVFSIPTGGTNSMDINYDGNQRIGVDIGQAKLQISEFVYLQGGFAFEKGPTYAVDIATGIPANVVSVIDSIAPLKSATDTVLGVAAIGSTLSTLNDVEVASMTIGASDIQAFVGVGGPYKSDADLGVDADGDGNAYNDYVINDDAMGVAIDNLDFGMAIMDTTSPLINPILDRFTALKATADKGGLVGFDDDAVLEAYDITIQVNDGPEWPGGHGPAVIDWATSFESSAGAGDGVFSIPTGGTNSMDINYDGNQRIGVDIGQAKLQISEFCISARWVRV